MEITIILEKGNFGKAINRREELSRSEADNERSLDTLDEACTRTGWLIHGFVLMQNHYHMLLETLE